MAQKQIDELDASTFDINECKSTIDFNECKSIERIQRLTSMININLTCECCANCRHEIDIRYTTNCKSNANQRLTSICITCM